MAFIGAKPTDKPLSASDLEFVINPSSKSEELTGLFAGACPM